MLILILMFMDDHVDIISFFVDLCQRKGCFKSIFIIFALKYQTN